MMLSGPDPTEPASGNGFESNGDHADSDASTSSGDIDCQIVDDSSRDEEIDEKLHVKECLGTQSSDPSSQSLPPLSRKGTGSSEEISHCFKLEPLLHC